MHGERVKIIDSVFVDNSYLNKFDIIPLINGLSDHNAELLTIQFVQKHNKDRCTYFKRNINQYTIAEQSNRAPMI
jgi:hypothetical protein